MTSTQHRSAPEAKAVHAGRSEAQKSRQMLIGVAAIVVAMMLGLLFGAGSAPATLLGVAVIGLVAGVAVVINSPEAMYMGLAFVLGGIPYAVVPGAGPAILVLALGVWAALATHRIGSTRTHPIEVAVVFLLLVSVASIIISASNSRHVSEAIKWIIAVSVMFPLMRLTRPALRRVGLAYVAGATLGGGFSFVLFLVDKSGKYIEILAPIGYGKAGTIGTTLRFFEVGTTSVVRLTGTYIDPNGAGLFLFLGLMLAIALTRGWVRLVTAPVIGLALLASLSRSAIISVVAAVVIFTLFQRLRGTARTTVFVGLILGTVAALSNPTVNARIFNSFGSNDRGTDDRSAALRDFIPSMTGHWWFGRGWGAKEFIDEVAGYQANYVANAPLLTIYRGGIMVGVAFVIVMIVGVVYGYRTMRRLPWESGVIGAGYIAFALLALNLDFPVVTNAAATMMYSIMLAMLARNPITPYELDDDGHRLPDSPSPDHPAPTHEVSHG